MERIFKWEESSHFSTLYYLSLIGSTYRYRFYKIMKKSWWKKFFKYTWIAWLQAITYVDYVTMQCGKNKKSLSHRNIPWNQFRLYDSFGDNVYFTEFLRICVISTLWPLVCIRILKPKTYGVHYTYELRKFLTFMKFWYEKFDICNLQKNKNTIAIKSNEGPRIFCFCYLVFWEKCLTIITLFGHDLPIELFWTKNQNFLALSSKDLNWWKRR